MKCRMRDREGHSCQENITSLGCTQKKPWRVKLLIRRNEARGDVEWSKTVKLLMYLLNTTSWVWELRGLVGSGPDFAPAPLTTSKPGSLLSTRLPPTIPLTITSPTHPI